MSMESLSQNRCPDMTRKCEILLIQRVNINLSNDISIYDLRREVSGLSILDRICFVDRRPKSSRWLFGYVYGGNGLGSKFVFGIVSTESRPRNETRFTPG